MKLNRLGREANVLPQSDVKFDNAYSTLQYVFMA
jgi:hypothetical protein